MCLLHFSQAFCVIWMTRMDRPIWKQPQSAWGALSYHQRLHTITAPNTSFLHWLRTPPYTSLSLKDCCYLISQEPCTLHICSGTFNVYCTRHVYTRTVSVFILFLFKLLFFSFQYLSVIVSIFWDFLLRCCLFPSVVLCYLWISPKGDQLRNILFHPILSIGQWISLLSFMYSSGGMAAWWVLFHGWPNKAVFEGVTSGI